MKIASYGLSLVCRLNYYALSKDAMKNCNACTKLYMWIKKRVIGIPERYHGQVIAQKFNPQFLKITY